MSIKRYDKDTGNWLPLTSNQASGIRVIDAEGNFITTDENGNIIKDVNNVEEALKYNANRIKQLEERVQYIYENGTIGGNGGGGGGGAMPRITIISPMEITATVDEEVVINFQFSSPNIGIAKAYLSITGSKEIGMNKTLLTQGNHSWNLGTFETGVYQISMYIVDAGGMYATMESPITLNCGSLTLISRFDDSIDFTIASNIRIPFSIESITKDPITVYLDIDGIKKLSMENLEEGDYFFNIGKITSTGQHKIKMWAEAPNMNSNKLQWSILIVDTNNIYVTANFEETEIQEGTAITVPFRISKAGESYAKARFFINDVQQGEDVTVSLGGYRYWNIGSSLMPGTYNLRIEAYTTDYAFGTTEGTHWKHTIEIVVGDFARIRQVTRGALALFSADGKNGTMSTWTDDSGNDVTCELHNFNFTSNGWDNGYALKFSGKAYADINLAPWASNIRNGFTLDIFYKATDVGNKDANVLWMKNHVTPYQGIKITPYVSEMRSAATVNVGCSFRDSSRGETWEHLCFVVDRDTSMAYTYINGVISKINNYADGENFMWDGKIRLGAGVNTNGELDNFANCSIRSIRIYDRALTDDEVVQNYLADIKDNEEQKRVYDLNYGTQEIPLLNIDSSSFGSMTDKNEVYCDMQYNDPVTGTRFNLQQCLISWQGTSSLRYPVHNYTIKLRENGIDYPFAPKEDWISEARFTLKANFMESSHANNITGARFANDLWKEIHPYPSTQINNKCRGAVDGFPIRLTLNGVFAGMYTFNIDRYAIENLGYNTTEDCMAYELSSNADGFVVGDTETETWNAIAQKFMYRYHYADEGQARQGYTVKLDTDGKTEILDNGSHLHDELIKLVKWVATSSDSDFRGELKEHFVVEELMDYFLIVNLLGLVDNLGKNMVICTWGRDTEQNMIWHPMFYDCDSSLGLTNDGELTYGSGIDMERGDFNTYDSNLWVKLLRNFQTEIRVRYGYLRDQGWFTIDKVLQYLDDGLISKIGAKFYNMDARLKYMGDNRGYAYLTNGNRLEHTRRWITERISYLDSVYEYGGYVDMSATIRTNIKSVLTLRIKTYHPQMVTVRFQDGTSLLKKYCDNTDYTVFSTADVDSFAQWGGVCQNDKDNNIAIMGVENILDIQGLEDMNVSHLLYSNMKRITTIQMQRAPIREITLGQNIMLQKIDLKDCKQLGYNALTGIYDGGLDVSNCENLRYLDISGTGLSRLSLSIIGGNLDYFNASSTNIVSVNMIGQPYLEEIKMQNCTHLATFKAENCTKLKRVLVPNTKINSFTVAQCEEMEEIDISNTSSLNNLVLDGCPNLLKLNMSGFQNPNFTELNLTTCPKIKELDISGCGYLTNISFEQNCSSLQKFRCKDSSITAIRFGRQNDFPNYLDLSNFDLKSLSFENCPRIVNIKGLDYVGNGVALFYGCRNLETIEGKLKCTEGIDYIAAQCGSLTSLPEKIDFTEATSATNAFWECWSLPKSECKRVAKTCPNVTDGGRMFAGTAMGSLDEDFFSNMGSLEQTWRMFNGNVNGTLHPNLFKPLVNLVSATYMFEGCTDLTGGIPSGFFSECTKLEDCTNMFFHCGFNGEIPENIFDNCPNLKSVQSMFAENYFTCRIPSNIFKNNTRLENAAICFTRNPNIYGEIPRDIFKGSSNERHYNRLENISYIFESTGISGEVPEDIFVNCPILKNVNGVFKDCSNITGSIPENILQPCASSLLSADEMFGLDAGINGTIPSNLFANCTNLSSISGFFRQTKITGSIPTGLLRDCPNLMNVSSLFAECSGIAGTIPQDLLSYTNELLNVAGLFRGCHMLTSDIPENLFANCSKVEDMRHMFEGCYRLRGQIPADLFRNCRKVRFMSWMFANCRNLGNATPTEINPYYMPNNLFHDCPLLEDVSNMFQMWGADDGAGAMAANSDRRVPEDLFKYCPNLRDCSALFAGNGMVGGAIPSMFFYYNTNLRSIESAFWGSSFNAMGDNLLDRNLKLENVAHAFRESHIASGTATPIWDTSVYKDINSYTMCFRGLEELSNYNDIPSTWK